MRSFELQLEAYWEHTLLKDVKRHIGFPHFGSQLHLAIHLYFSILSFLQPGIISLIDVYRFRAT